MSRQFVSLIAGCFSPKLLVFLWTVQTKRALVTIRHAIRKWIILKDSLQEQSDAIEFLFRRDELVQNFFPEKLLLYRSLKKKQLPSSGPDFLNSFHCLFNCMLQRERIMRMSTSSLNGLRQWPPLVDHKTREPIFWRNARNLVLPVTFFFGRKIVLSLIMNSHLLKRLFSLFHVSFMA